MNKNLDEIRKFVDLIQCKNNHKAYYSKKCPFCGEIGKRPFYYNTKLKVGKSFCCGVSFKDISWFRKLILDRDGCEMIFIESGYHSLKPNMSKEQKEILKAKYFEDKMKMGLSSFEKSDDDDLSLPF